MPDESKDNQNPLDKKQWKELDRRKVWNPKNPHDKAQLVQGDYVQVIGFSQPYLSDKKGAFTEIFVSRKTLKNANRAYRELLMTLAYELLHHLETDIWYWKYRDTSMPRMEFRDIERISDKCVKEYRKKHKGDKKLYKKMMKQKTNLLEPYPLTLQEPIKRRARISQISESIKYEIIPYSDGTEKIAYYLDDGDRNPEALDDPITTVGLAESE